MRGSQYIDKTNVKDYPSLFSVKAVSLSPFVQHYLIRTVLRIETLRNMLEYVYMIDIKCALHIN
jgi:hypothetical protein